MKITTKSYGESLIALCKGKTVAQIDACVKEFLSYLARRGISRKAFAILESLRDTVARQASISRITVTSAHLLEKSERESFEKILQGSFGKKSSVNFEVDARLVSGFRIKAQDSVVDASFAGQLNSLRNYLKQSVSISS